jgi:molybdate transport system permease protein
MGANRELSKTKEAKSPKNTNAAMLQRRYFNVEGHTAYNNAIPVLALMLTPLLLSLQIAGIATILAVMVGLPIAWWLGVGQTFRGKILLETLITLPLVLPPTVVGYGLLLIFGRGTAFGRFLQDSAHVQLLFTWQGAAIAAAVMSLPLFVRTAAAALASVDTELLEAGRTLGATETRLLTAIMMPLAYRGLLAAGTLAFARALGEFGATLMIAGNIPGETQTLPLALYSAVQAGEDVAAWQYALVLTAVAFFLLGLVGIYGGRIAAGRGERH